MRDDLRPGVRILPARCIRGLALLGLLCGCDAKPGAVARIAQWSIASAPALRLGSDLPTGHEFAGIVSARRLSDRRILVANAGALELALFDSSGHFVRTIGRKGSGPGEFVATVNLFAAAADSLAVYDGGNMRWSIFAPSLALSRTFPTSDPGSPHPGWVRHGALVIQPGVEPAPEWVRTVIDTLRAADPEVTGLIEGRVDDVGAFWVRAAAESDTWDVYTGPGSAVGRVQVPRGMQVLQIGRDFVLGVVTDSMDLETVALFPMTRPTEVAAQPVVESGAQPPAHPDLTSDPTLRAQLAREIMTAQEQYYSDHGSYTGRADSLKYAFDPPARLFLLYGDKRHWAGIVVRLKTFATCGVSVGFPAQAGWDDGAALCDR